MPELEYVRSPRRLLAPADEKFMTAENAQMAQHPVTDNAVVLGALGVLAYAASMMTHEALGHGVYCLAAGGHNTGLTAWAEECNLHPVGIEAAGPGLQFAAGLLAWLVLRLLPPDAARLRYFFWSYMVFDLFISSGYVAFSGVTNFGDAAVIIAGFRPHIVWRGVLILLGAATYYLSMRATALELERFAGTDRGGKRLFRLVWIPYVAVGVFACCAAALNRTMPASTVIGLAAASSLGAGFGMLRLPAMQSRVATGAPRSSVYLGWSVTWVLAAAVVVAGFLIFIGPGLEWHVQRFP
jgi:hypothetical protein